MVNIINKETNVVFDKSIDGSSQYYYTMPSFERLSNNEWIVCSRQAMSLSDPKGRIKVKKSYDQGVTWSATASPTHHDENYYPDNGFLMCHITQIMPNNLIAVYVMIYTNEDKPLFSPVTDGMQLSVVRFTHSYDNGLTWDKPKDIDYRIKDLLIPGKAIKLPDGSIGIPCETHDIWEEGYKEPLSSKFIISTDNGDSFNEGFNVVSHQHLLYGDARMMYFDNRIWIYFWTYNTKDNRDENVHRVFSTDVGRTWSLPEPVELRTQITSPANIKDKYVLVITQDRFSNCPGIKAMLSFDGGTTFDESSVCMIYEAASVPDGQNPFAQFTQFKFGYSTITPLVQNNFAVCYWHDNGITTSVSISVIDIDDL